MKASERHTALETAQARALVLLFATLVLLGIGKAFAPDAPHPPERAAIAYQAHTDACQAVPAAGFQFPGQDTPLLLSGYGKAGEAERFISNFPHPFFLPGQVAGVFAFTPNVKRFILFSCQKLETPPLAA